MPEILKPCAILLSGNISCKGALVPSQERNEHFDSTVLKAHQTSEQVTFSFVNILSIEA